MTMSTDEGLFSVRMFDRQRDLLSLARIGSTAELGVPAIVLASESGPDFPHEGPFIVGPGRWLIEGTVETSTETAALATLVEFLGRVSLREEERETLARYLEHVAAGLRRWPPEVPEPTRQDGGKTVKIPDEAA